MGILNFSFIKTWMNVAFMIGCVVSVHLLSIYLYVMDLHKTIDSCCGLPACGPCYNVTCVLAFRRNVLPQLPKLKSTRLRVSQHRRPRYECYRRVNQKPHATELRCNYEPTAVYGSTTDAKCWSSLS